MPRPFLTARWTNLCIFSFAVPPDLLLPHLPPGLELDTRDGQAFASLVAFQFLDTRLLGIRWPGHRNFPELNLRFYVRHGSARGVVFIREIIPLPFPAWVARVFYNEPYAVAPLAEQIVDHADSVSARYRLVWKGLTHELSVTGEKPARAPAETSVEHFFKEQRWGYGRDRRRRATRFEVEHPVWRTHAVRSWRLDFDWGEVYGPEWKLLNGKQPCSVILAAGSAVSVFPKGRLQI